MLTGLKRTEDPPNFGDPSARLFKALRLNDAGGRRIHLCVELGMKSVFASGNPSLTRHADQDYETNLCRREKASRRKASEKDATDGPIHSGSHPFRVMKNNQSEESMRTLEKMRERHEELMVSPVFPSTRTVSLIWPQGTR